METVKYIIAVIGAAIGEYMGAFDGMLHALVVFVVIDYVSGVLRAIGEHNVSSEIGAKGIAKKVGIFVLVGIANIIDVHIIGGEHLMRSATIAFYLANEGISIIENLAILGLPVPERLVDVLKQVKGGKAVEHASEAVHVASQVSNTADKIKEASQAINELGRIIKK